MKKNSIYFLIEQARKGQKEDLQPPNAEATTFHDEETTVVCSEKDEQEGKREVMSSVIGLSGNMVKNSAMLPIDGGKKGSQEGVVVLDLKPKKAVPCASNQEQRGASNENRIKVASSNLQSAKHPVPLKSI
jgi:hypothetical protein